MGVIIKAAVSEELNKSESGGHNKLFAEVVSIKNEAIHTTDKWNKKTSSNYAKSCFFTQSRSEREKRCEEEADSTSKIRLKVNRLN